ncbi:MAG: hypothetical protein GY715_07290 [Planctomycetes bacterium]|nr:hypothetical protein [Planctomycetota bacterium]
MRHRFLSIVASLVSGALLAGCAELLMLENWLGLSGSSETLSAQHEVSYGDVGSSLSSERDPWKLLAERYHTQALRVFAWEIERCPGYGRPVVGYAITAAQLDDLTGGAQAMRWVLERDPRALRSAPIGMRIERQLDELTGRYRELLEQQWTGRVDPDVVLMMGAIYLLLHDHDSARLALAVTCRLSGESAATRGLGSMLVRARGGRVARRPLTLPQDRPRDDEPVELRSAVAAEAAPDALQPPEPGEFERRPSPNWPPPGLIAPGDELPVKPAPVAAVTPETAAGPAPAPVSASVSASGAAPASATATAPVSASVPESAPAPTVPATPATPTKPVDYDKLRDEIRTASDALDRFAQKLLGAIAEAGGITPAQEPKPPADAPGS